MNRNPFTDILHSSDRIMRFFSPKDPIAICKHLAREFDDLLVQYKVWPTFRKVTFSTVDRRKCPLTGEITLQKAGAGTFLVAFKKSKVFSCFD